MTDRLTFVWPSVRSEWVLLLVLRSWAARAARSAEKALEFSPFEKECSVLLEAEPQEFEASRAAAFEVPPVRGPLEAAEVRRPE